MESRLRVQIDWIYIVCTGRLYDFYEAAACTDGPDACTDGPDACTEWVD